MWFDLSSWHFIPSDGCYLSFVDTRLRGLGLGLKLFTLGRWEWNIHLKLSNLHSWMVVTKHGTNIFIYLYIYIYIYISLQGEKRQQTFVVWRLQNCIFLFKIVIVSYTSTHTQLIYWLWRSIVYCCYFPKADNFLENIGSASVLYQHWNSNFTFHYFKRCSRLLQTFLFAMYNLLRSATYVISPSYVKCCTPVFQMFVSASSNVALRCFRVTFWNLPFWKSLCRMLLFLWLLNRIFLVMGHAMIHEWTVYCLTEVKLGWNEFGNKSNFLHIAFLLLATDWLLI